MLAQSTTGRIAPASEGSVGLLRQLTLTTPHINRRDEKATSESRTACCLDYTQSIGAYDMISRSMHVPDVKNVFRFGGTTSDWLTTMDMLLGPDLQGYQASLATGS